MTEREALKLALEALEEAWYHVGTFQPTEKAIDLYDEARTAIKEALAQPDQEPVEASKKDKVFDASIEFIGLLTGMTPPPIEVAPPEVFKPFRDFTEKVCSIFATPPQRKPLTEDEVVKMDEWLFDQPFWRVLMLVRAIEAAHGIKGEA